MIILCSLSKFIEHAVGSLRIDAWQQIKNSSVNKNKKHQHHFNVVVVIIVIRIFVIMVVITIINTIIYSAILRCQIGDKQLCTGACKWNKTM